MYPTNRSYPIIPIICCTLILVFLPGAVSSSKADAQDYHTPTSVTAAPSTTTCTEDMSCWDCTTMGNQTCGESPDYPAPQSPDYPAPARPTPIEPSFTG